MCVVGASGLSGKRKKAYEEKKIVALGGKLQRKERVPYPILMGMLKKQKEREDRRARYAYESGLVRLSSAPTKRKRKKRDDGVSGHVGVWKQGMLHVDVEQQQQKKGKR